MTQYLRALREAKDTQDGLMYFIASTEGIKRDGQDLKMEDWRFDNFNLNPVFLYVHDYRGEHLPLGRVSKLETVDRKIRVGVEWDTADEFAMQVKGKYDKGMMNAVSVGWDCIKDGNRVYNDLLDVSAVPVPGDPQALILRQAAALRRTLNELTSDERTESEASIFDGVASAMLALYRDYAAIEDEDDHRAIYNQLERVYKRLGKVAPEYRTKDDLAKLSQDDVAGLFLEGEVRVGAVLNKRNSERLKQAQSLIQEVLDTAEKQDDSTQDDERTMSDSEMSKMKSIMEMMNEMKSMMESMMKQSEKQSVQVDPALQRLHQVFQTRS